ncbi:hypothetical protein HU200_029183 [Digitaria exilis]|uniref:PGG domain-containing protein n=1 Tax=Digitaria exilis TaxID=1010633 RepID=A0A835BYV5_9POAL|nr:hypothetical protein HU200_029183 [Digitaria exilis]
MGIIQHAQCDILEVSAERNTVLHVAAEQGHDKLIRELYLRFKEQVLLSRQNSALDTPLHCTARRGHVRAITVLIQLAQDCGESILGCKNEAGDTALHLAARHGHAVAVKVLVSAAAEPTAEVNNAGMSLLYLAWRTYWPPDTAELRDDDGATFVHAAAREKQFKVVSLAIKSHTLRGLLDAQDRHGNTPLHLAVATGAPGVAEALLRKGKVRADVLNNDGHTAFDLAGGTTSFFTMVKLVVILVAFGAQLGPRRHDRLTPWCDRSTVENIHKTSDSLAVVAVLVATAAFTAGFNMPGGYRDTGEASLAGKAAFEDFVFLDAMAVATSVTAAILFVYGKASRSGGGSWKSFAWALQCMWVSLLSLLLAFHAALDSVVTSTTVHYGFLVVYVCMSLLLYRIQTWIGTLSSSPRRCTILRFLWQRCHSNGRHDGIFKRLYPLVGASVFHFFVFTIPSSIAFFCLARTIEIKPADWGLGTSSPAPAPSPL